MRLLYMAVKTGIMWLESHFHFAIALHYKFVSVLPLLIQPFHPSFPNDCFWTLHWFCIALVNRLAPLQLLKSLLVVY